MKEYHIRSVGRQRYEVAVFTWHKEPIVIYHISHGSCDCAARRKCKHLELLHLHRQLREPWLATYWLNNKWEWRIL